MDSSGNHSDAINIFVLDDEAPVRAVLARLLGKEYAVREASTIAEFRTLMEGGGGHVVLVDINLPDGSGLELCREIRAHECCADAFVLIMTGDISREVIEASYDAGANDFLRKPFVLQEVRAKVGTFANIIRAREGLKAANQHLSELNQEYHNEIAHIRKIQASQLPDFSGITNYEIAIAYLPACELSGDFMDGFFIDSNTYQFVICDISGHGMASSYVGTEVRTLFRSFSAPERSLSDVTVLVNEYMLVDLRGMYFYGTAVLCRLHLDSGVVELLNAGHPDALLVRDRTADHEVFESSGPMLGLFPVAEYPVNRITMDSGDILFIYTDGLTEAHIRQFDEDADVQMFGFPRLLRHITENRGLSPLEINHTLLGEMYEFTDYSDQLDDITAICIRKK